MARSPILVTGGAGFIGSNLSRFLLSQGFEIIIVDNLSVGMKDRVPRGAVFIEGDIQDQTLMGWIMKEYRIEAICHLAARVSIRSSVPNFYEDAMTNVLGTLSVLNAALTSNVAKFIFTSSMAVYADCSTPHTIDENYDTRPISPYGISKLASEQYIANILSSEGREYTILRLFNTYGPGQSYTPYVGVITIFITRLLHGESLHIFGDGRQIRDFVYVGDVANAFLQILQRSHNGGIFNIGSGTPRSVNDVADVLKKKINPAATVEYHLRQKEEIYYSIADISRAQTILNYAPKAIFEDEIDKVIETIRSLSSSCGQ